MTDDLIYARASVVSGDVQIAGFVNHQAKGVGREGSASAAADSGDGSDYTSGTAG